MDDLACQPTDVFRHRDTLAGDVQAIFIESPHPKVAFYLSSVQTMVVADALWGTPDGRIWVGSREFCSLLELLLAELSIETLLLSHAGPIVANAHAVLARVVAERPEWTDPATYL